MADYDSFKPTLLVAALVLAARKNLVASAFCNTNVAIGLKQKGDTVNINTLSDPTANNTSESVAMTYEELDTTATSLTLTIDKTVSVKLKDTERRQVERGSVALESAIGNRMIYVLADEVDQLVMGKYTDITTDNFETGSTSWQWGASPTIAEISKFFASVNREMDDVNADAEGRFMALPNMAIEGIRNAHSTLATGAGDAARVKGVMFRELHGFQVSRSSNCVSAASVTHGIAGNLANVGEGLPGAIALAIQIDPNIEKLRLEGFWADGIRARVTAGAAVYKPARMVDINLNDSLLA